MMICSSRGVKLGLECDDAFALLSRIHGKVNIFSVFSMADVIWKFPGFVAFLISLALIKVSIPLLFVLLVPSSIIAQKLFIEKEWIISPVISPLRFLAKGYSLLTGFGIVMALCLWLAYRQMGWVGCVAYLVANTLRIILDSRLQLRGDLRKALSGMLHLGYDPHCFLLAFKLYAQKCAVSCSYEISNAEIAAGRDVYGEFSHDWGIITKRFPNIGGASLPRKLDAETNAAGKTIAQRQILSGFGTSPIQIAKRISSKMTGLPIDSIVCEETYQTTGLGALSDIEVKSDKRGVVVEISGSYELKSPPKGDVLLEKVRHYSPLIQVDCNSLTHSPFEDPKDFSNRDLFELTILYVDSLGFAKRVGLEKVIHLYEIRISEYEKNTKYGGCDFYSCSWVEVAEALNENDHDLRIEKFVHVLSYYCQVLDMGLKKCGFVPDETRKLIRDSLKNDECS